MLAAVLISSVLCGCSQKEKRFQATYLDLFDTVTVIAGYERDKDTFDANAAMIYRELSEYNRLFDIYNDYDGISNIKTVNDNAGIAPVKVEEKIIDLLEFSKSAYELTSGRMNVAMGSVLQLWHEAREYGTEHPDSAYLPDDSALSEASKHTDISDIGIDRSAGTVFLSDPAMSIDVGAVGKGYAAQRVCSALRSAGISGYSVSIGGNVCTVGGKPDGTLWKVGVSDPSDASSPLLTLGVSDLSVVTSGSYQRFYTVDGTKYHHIIDPDTLYPRNLWCSVTVISPDSALADVLSTALFNMDESTGRELIESLPDTEAMWIGADGRTYFSSGFEDLILKD